MPIEKDNEQEEQEARRAAPEFEYKVLFDTRMEIKATGGKYGAGSLSGYAAVFSNRDLVGDMIMPGAFKGTIPNFLKNGVILARHGFGNDQPIATPTELKEDHYGLWFEGDYHSTNFAQQERTIAQERLERGLSVGNSMMFMPPFGGDVKDAYDWTPQGRTLKSLFLGEITTNATLPVNPKALLTGVKSVLDGSRDGLSLSDHSDWTLGVLDEYRLRVSGLLTLRKDKVEAGERKAGRMLSAQNVGKLQGMSKSLHDTLEQIDSLLDAALGEPEDSEPKSLMVFNPRSHRALLSELESWLATQGIQV